MDNRTIEEIRENETKLINELKEEEKEIDRLNKLLDETRLSELHKEYIINKLETELIGIYEGEYALNEEEIKDKLKELKENK